MGNEGRVAENWFRHPERKARYSRLRAPYDNIYIGSEPLDGYTEEEAKSFQAIVNVSCSSGAYFHPAYPGQYMHWYPLNEMGRWSYAYYFWLKKVLDFHYEKGHKILVHCHAGAYRSPHAAIYWLISRGHTMDEALSIELDDPALEAKFKIKEAGCRRSQWVYKREYALYQGNIPKRINEFFHLMREHPAWSLAGILLHGDWLENIPEVMGRREARRSHWLHIHFWFYYKPKYWLKRKLDYYGYYLKGHQVDTSGPGWHITYRPGRLAATQRYVVSRVDKIKGVLRGK